MEKSEKIALFAVVIHIVLLAIKYTFALLSGSIALKAEAIHSLSDIVASLTVFVGLKISKRKSKSFPYGLYKVENLVSILVALAIFFAGYEIVTEALSSGPSADLNHVPLTIASVLGIIGITFGFSRYEVRVGKQINSPSLIADGQHIRVDMFAGAVVLVGLLSSLIGINLDRIAALIIAAFIAWSGGEILLDAIRVLLDASLDYETLSTAENIIKSEPQVVEIQNLMGRNSGRYKFIEASIIMKTHDLDKAHFIANQIESKITEQIENADQVLIHYEPTHKEHLIYAAPLDESQESISEHFGEAPYFALVTVGTKDQKMTSKEIIANPFTHAERGKGILVAEYLSIDAIDISLPSKELTSLTLIANELISNAMKHAFKNRDKGSIIVKLKPLGNNICLQVKDDGIGLPEGFNINVNGRVGLEVSRTLAERDLNGTLNLVSNAGTTAEVIFRKYDRDEPDYFHCRLSGGLDG
ncbi:cation diffusion facilitator family transporter [bacterium]|nr:cation diffusion facilitator family transporter [bacterium]